MDIRNRRALKQAAAESLAAAPNQKKIIAVYAGGALLTTLVVALLDYLLSGMIAKLSGLSNMGSRMILQTIQMVLPLAQTIVLLFWDYGYIGLILGISHNRPVECRDITAGFRIMGPIARLTMLQYAITFVLTFASIYSCSILFVLSPFSAPLMDAMVPLMEGAALSPTEMAMAPTVTAALASAALPMLVMLLIIYCVLVIPVLYLFRLAPYCLLEDPRAGALAALRNSRALMRRNRWNLLKLDLSFWWYYLLTMIPVALCYGDQLLPLLGIELPFGQTAAYFLFYSLYIVTHFLLTYLFQNPIETTYAHAYEALKPKPQPGGVILGNIFQM